MVAIGYYPDSPVNQKKGIIIIAYDAARNTTFPYHYDF